MLENVKAYKNTSVNWGKSQTDIMRLLEDRGIQEVRFTNLSRETMIKNGIEMEEDTFAIMLEFFKQTTLSDGLAGKIPVRIVVPNIPVDGKKKNQAYRIFFWYLKTKFEAVETGLIEFEQEFMPHISIGGRGIDTVGSRFKEQMLPRIASGEIADIEMLEPPK